MAKLIPLSSVPYSARRIERDARKRYGSRDAALQAAAYKIVVAPGCHSEPYFNPPVIGWLCTRVAADAYCEVLTHMPGGTSHRRRAIG